MTRRRGTSWITAGVAVLLAVTGGGCLVLDGRTQDADARNARSADGLPPATAPVVRGDLGSSVQVDGVLGRSGERRLNSAGPGVLTWLAPEGTSVERDGKLYELNGRPVRLMYGSVPMYRALKAGDKGEDVKQLKRSLRALGHGTGLDPEDGRFTEGTVTAVKRWQKAHGMKQTGEVAREDLAFAAGPQRIGKAEAAVGDEPGPNRPVLAVTGTDRIVRFSLDAAQAGTVKAGDRVSVSLPGGGTAAGRVDTVGAAANPDDGSGSGGSGGGGAGSGGGGGGGDGKAKIEVSVVFDDPAAVKAPDRSPVSVRLTGEIRRGVLSVPVNALLALTGGGFGVQVVEHGTVREVKVGLGMFGDGRVEVTGDGLKEGMEVGVPQT